jgi:2-hydroxychromene-2-carboxylate isomerase
MSTRAGSGMPDMSGHTIKLYFDYNSPYSYIASLQVEELCRRVGAELHWMPVVLGGIFQSNSIEPAHTKVNRRKYLFEDLKDLAAFYGLPYRERTVFLFKPILALRATLAVPQGPQRAKAVHALYRGAFAEDLDLGEPAVVARLLGEAGLDGTALVERTQDAAIKNELKAITDEAIAKGVFGAPTFFVDDRKMFWGHDRMPLMEHYLKKSA